MAASLKAFFKGKLFKDCATYGGLYMAAETCQQTYMKKVVVSSLKKSISLDYRDGVIRGVRGVS